MRLLPPRLLLFSTLVALASGCRSIGPGTVPRDRMHYAAAVAESWKEQLLLNIVKLRFADAPAFLEVASVVSGYTLETGVSLGGQLSPQNLRGDTFGAAGVSGKLTDRPTISYSPMTGARYARSLISPVPLEALLHVMQGGSPADFLLGLTAQCIEGHHNAGMFAGRFQAADPSFTRLLQLFRVLQHANVAESELTTEEGRTVAHLRFHVPETASEALKTELAEARSLLGIPAAADRVRVTFANEAADPEVIGLRTRSLLQMLNALGVGVSIPPDHPARQSAYPVDPALVPRGFTVWSAKDKPADPFVAVPYEGLWFWIDRHDLPSKSTLTAVTLLFNFLEGGSKESPVLTIPTN